jgi:WD40 repeat protein
MKSLLQGHKGALSGLVILPDGSQIITSGADGQILFWNPTLAAPIGQWAMPGPVAELALSPDGRYLAASNKHGSVFLFRMQEAEQAK